MQIPLKIATKHEIFQLLKKLILIYKMKLKIDLKDIVYNIFFMIFIKLF